MIYSRRAKMDDYDLRRQRHYYAFLSSYNLARLLTIYIRPLNMTCCFDYEMADYSCRLKSARLAYFRCSLLIVLQHFNADIRSNLNSRPRGKLPRVYISAACKSIFGKGMRLSYVFF